MILLLDELGKIEGIFWGKVDELECHWEAYRYHHLRKLRCPPTNGLTNNPQYRDQKLRLAKLLPACFPGNIYMCFLVEKIPDATTLGFTPKLLSPRTWFHREPQFDSIQVSRLVLLHSPPSCAPPPKGFVCAMATCYLWRIWNPNGSHGTLKRKSNQLKEKGSLFFWQKKKDPTPKIGELFFCWKTEWCHFVGGGFVVQVDWLE